MNVLPGLLKKVRIKDILKKGLSVYVHVQVCWTLTMLLLA